MRFKSLAVVATIAVAISTALVSATPETGVNQGKQPWAPRYVVVDSFGNEVGNLLSYDTARTEILTAFPNGSTFTPVRMRINAFVPIGVLFFQSTDCTGQAFVNRFEPLPVAFVQDAAHGYTLWGEMDAAPQVIVTGSILRTNDACSRVGGSRPNMFPMQQLAVLGAEFFPPFSIVQP